MSRVFDVRENVYVAIMTAVAVVMGLIESMFPPFFAFAPGAKIGLPNLIMLIAVFTMRGSKVWTMLILRLVITALFTGFSVFLYSTAGGVLSLLAMYLVKRLGPRLVSLVGVSVAGGFFHNVGQLAMASFIAQTPAVMVYLPWLAFFGILAGLAIGVGGNLLIRRIKPITLLFETRSQLWV
ncbi:MAG: Gx transporter family protein [Streptococcaceae bacterium]|jgi:heptaprenyl diphosphate synthase|nr:Gx transporter family protein [Streptococcaceae bacterium]